MDMIPFALTVFFSFNAGMLVMAIMSLAKNKTD